MNRTGSGAVLLLMAASAAWGFPLALTIFEIGGQ